MAKIADMKKALAISSQKMESHERDIKQIAKIVEDIRNEQLASWSVPDSGEEFPSSATKPLESGDVDVRPQVKHVVYRLIACVLPITVLVEQKLRVGTM